MFYLNVGKVSAYLSKISVDGRKVLKVISKQCCRMCIGLVWLWVRTGGALL
jgi:hypothetical protein